jgi:hypothetical protein
VVEGKGICKRDLGKLFGPTHLGTLAGSQLFRRLCISLIWLLWVDLWINFDRSLLTCGALLVLL